jgi:pimeloyl-ACP methyl ester carboxylesterase
MRHVTRYIVAAFVATILASVSPAEARQGGALDLNAITKTVTVNGMAFPVIDQGTGPAVLLLHGFPDSRFLWRHQIKPLLDAGFRVIAPDLRGFGDAPKPTAVADYRLQVIATDVIGILDALGVQQTRIVGHDWGAALTWFLASTNPKRFEKVVALSVGAIGNSGLNTLAQREKSWYFLFFQFEGVAEATLQQNDWAFFKEFARGQGDTERYWKDLARPGALTAGLNWYRANVRPQMPVAIPLMLPKVSVPTMGIWSDGDVFLTEEQMTRSPERLSGTWRYEKIAGAGHWLMLDKPAELNRLLLDFLK